MKILERNLNLFLLLRRFLVLYYFSLILVNEVGQPLSCLSQSRPQGAGDMSIRDQELLANKRDADTNNENNWEIPEKYYGFHDFHKRWVLQYCFHFPFKLQPRMNQPFVELGVESLDTRNSFFSLIQQNWLVDMSIRTSNCEKISFSIMSVKQRKFFQNS